MKLDTLSIDRVCQIINGEIIDLKGEKYRLSPYKTGPKLVELFNRHGFRDVYQGEGFPKTFSRKNYTISKLTELNGTKKLEEFFNDFMNSRQYIEFDIDIDDLAQCINDIINYNGYTLKLVDDEYIVIGEGLLEYSDTINVDSYDLGELLGYGGFGSVYKYHNQFIDMDFAIKILEPVFVNESEQEVSEKRFFREAKILFSLNHPNIVRVYDIGTVNKRPFIRMELIEGYDMYEFNKRHSIVNYQRSLVPIKELVIGMKYAHEKGVIHRDLKPSNFMTGKGKSFKIIDFGISAFLDMNGHEKLTKIGQEVSGGLFSDPILNDNPKLRDVRSDIYSIGAIWHYLLTGKAPYGSDMKNNLINISDIDEQQADIVMKCLSSNIDERYSTCEDLLLIINEEMEKLEC